MRCDRLQALERISETSGLPQAARLFPKATRAGDRDGAIELTTQRQRAYSWESRLVLMVAARDRNLRLTLIPCGCYA